MTMSTIAWAMERRYGDPLLRHLMVSLAMDTGSQPFRAVPLSHLAAETEIEAPDLPRLLDRLVADGHIVSWGLDVDDRDLAFIGFDDDGFPEYEPPPEPRESKGSVCTRDLRNRVILAFRGICTYCGEPGDAVNGPDQTAWHVDRIVAGGLYDAANVTLACRPCNCSKRDRPAPDGTPSLADVEEAGRQ